MMNKNKLIESTGGYYRIYAAYLRQQPWDEWVSEKADEYITENRQDTFKEYLKESFDEWDKELITFANDKE